MDTANATVDTLPEVRPSDIMDTTRLDCMLSSLQAMLPQSETGRSTYGFILVLADLGELETEEEPEGTMPVGMFSNITDLEAKHMLLAELLGNIEAGRMPERVDLAES